MIDTTRKVNDDKTILRLDQILGDVEVGQASRQEQDVLEQGGRQGRIQVLHGQADEGSKAL